MKYIIDKGYWKDEPSTYNSQIHYLKWMLENGDFNDYYEILILLQEEIKRVQEFLDNDECTDEQFRSLTNFINDISLYINA